MFESTHSTSQQQSSGSIERLNRETFRACLEALARPGLTQQVQPLFHSHLLAMASSLLYSKIRYTYRGRLSTFNLVEAMTGATQSPPAESQYIFADTPSIDLWKSAFPGTMEQPETSATCIFSCREEPISPVTLCGPGINGTLRTHLPLEQAFVKEFITCRHSFPLGVDLFLVNESGHVTGLPRTTRIEVRQ